MQVVGLDVGRSAVKVYSGTKLFHFPSAVGEWRERNLVTDYGDAGFAVELNGEQYFVGELAVNESDFCRQMMTESKAHEDTRVLALSALHRAGYEDVVVFTGLPIALHKPEHKEALRELLIGEWVVSLNGEARRIRVRDVKVAAEGGAAFWSQPQDGKLRIIDAGSKTVNCVTMNNRRYVDRESDTLEFGYETNKSSDPKQFASRVAGEVGKKWSAQDALFTAGGRAEELAEQLRPFFPKARALPNAFYANAIGFFKIGVATAHV